MEIAKDILHGKPWEGWGRWVLFSGSYCLLLQIPATFLLGNNWKPKNSNLRWFFSEKHRTCICSELLKTKSWQTRSKLSQDTFRKHDCVSFLWASLRSESFQVDKSVQCWIRSRKVWGRTEPELVRVSKIVKWSFSPLRIIFCVCHCSKQTFGKSGFWKLQETILERFED